YQLNLIESGQGGSLQLREAVHPTRRREHGGRGTEGLDYPAGVLAREYSHIRPSAKGVLDPTSRHERELDYLTLITLEILKERSFDFVTFYSWLPDSFNHGM